MFKSISLLKIKRVIGFVKISINCVCVLMCTTYFGPQIRLKKKQLKKEGKPQEVPEDDLDKVNFKLYLWNIDQIHQNTFNHCITEWNITYWLDLSVLLKS